MSHVEDNIEKSVPGEVVSRSESEGTSYDPNASYEPETPTKNIFKRMWRSYLPPEDDKLHAHMDPREKALMYMSRSKPKLSRRHLMIIAASSCVGTGLFIGSKSSLIVAGPAGLLLAFAVMGLNMICTMSSAGELSLRYPSISPMYTLSARFLHPSLGFTIGWMYMFVWLVTAPLELIAAAELTQFWRGDNNPGAKASPVAWVAILYVFNIFINLSGSVPYAELEFLVGCIKVCAMLGFIIFGLVADLGGTPHGHYIGAHNFHNPAPFLNSFKGWVTALVSCSFAYGGTEVSGIAAAETANPIRSIPSAVKQAFWRIIIFFIVGILFVCLLVPAESNIYTRSPFIMALINTGVYALPSIFNSVIICSVIGVSNAAMYACSRTLTALAVDGAAPKWFCYLDRKGRPTASIMLVIIFSAIAFVSADTEQYNNVFNWLYAFASLGFLFAWSGINLSHLRFRWVMKSQGRSLSELLYTSPLGIPGSILGAFISIGTLGVQFWVYIFPVGAKNFDANEYFQNDLSIPVFIFVLICHKIWYWKTSTFTSNKNMDLDIGVREIDFDEVRRMNEEDAVKEKKNFLRKLARWAC